MSKRLRVLVVDDSAHNRRTIADILDGHPDIEVVALADDGEKALKAAAALRPDLITLDLEMPRMDGFTFLRIIMSQMPTPVIVISSESRKQAVFQVLELGALDFIVKPSRFFAAGEQSLREQIISKALAVRALQIVPFSKRGAGRGHAVKLRAQALGQRSAAPRAEAERRVVSRMVCIGASTGGPPALQSIFKALTPDAVAAFTVAQHMPEKFTKAFAERLNRISSLDIMEAEDGMPLLTGGVYIAPGGSHLEVARGKAGEWIARVARAEPMDRYSPSIDLLFSSGAKHFGAASLAVVLTGMGSDGSVGVRSIREAGGRTIAESQETAIVYGMPKEAISTGCVDETLPLEAIVQRVYDFSRSEQGE